MSGWMANKYLLAHTLVTMKNKIDTEQTVEAAHILFCVCVCVIQCYDLHCVLSQQKQKIEPTDKYKRKSKKNFTRKT